MNASLKISQIESKISKLQAEQQELLKQHLLDVVDLMSKMDLTQIDVKVLSGGLLFLRDKVSTHDPIMEDWRQAGERFLRKHRTKRKSSSKKIAQADTTAQPMQSSLQSREN